MVILQLVSRSASHCKLQFGCEKKASIAGAQKRAHFVDLTKGSKTLLVEKVPPRVDKCTDDSVERLNFSQQQLLYYYYILLPPASYLFDNQCSN